MTTPLDKMLRQLLDFAVCPDVHTPLLLGSPELLQHINEAIANGKIRDRSASLVGEQVDALLVREDIAVAYPVVGGIPVLLVEAAIPLDATAKTYV